MIQRLAGKPILLGIGLLMALVVLLALVSMLTSVVIARTTEGLASAVNQSGSLRMQSYRIGMAMADASVPGVERRRRVTRLADEFDARLASPRLSAAIPMGSSHEVRAAYQRVWHAWRERMRPALGGDLERISTAVSSAGPTPSSAYLELVDDFVTEVDALVGLLEAAAEGQIAALQRVQAGALVLTLTVVVIAMLLLARRVIAPLGELLTYADQARQGDFTGRTRFTGKDELGRLGAAMNRMAADLSLTYGDLERRVAEKTRDLARTNHSLELLYQVGTRLNDSPIGEPLLKRVLSDIQGQLGLGPVTLCLHDHLDQERGRLTLTTRTPEQQAGACSRPGCLACRDFQGPEGFDLPLAEGDPRRVLALPVADRGERFGVLIVDLRPAETLEPWQVRLLETLAGHLGTAIKLHLREREGRRLALYEERGILARELHDSLAQSLSYLKIQAARLSAALDAADTPAARGVLAELREGIGSAYRQLRELLTTFRLKMDERGLGHALGSTVQEFRERGGLIIDLDDRLPANLLSPNEEIHVLQIVREALSNVSRHAGASRVRVRLARVGEAVEVEIVDDGRGAAAAAVPLGHYGLTIMRERALTLDGELRVDNPTEGGTRVLLRFRHRASLESDAGPVSVAP